MAFDLSAFFGGVAKGVATQIETQDERLFKETQDELTRLTKEKDENEARLQTRRDKLKLTASVLAGYRGADNKGFTEGQIIGLLQNPGKAQRVIAELDAKKDNLENIDFQKIYNISKNDPTERDPVTNAPRFANVKEYIEATTSYAPAIKEQLTDEAKNKISAQRKEGQKGVYGLRTRARGEAESEFERRTGMSTQELRIRAKAIPEEALTAEGTLDFSQFKEPETVEKQIQRIGIGIVKAREAGNKQEEAELNARLKVLHDVKETIDPEKNTYAGVVSAKQLAFAREKDPTRKAKLREELADLVQAGRVGKSEAPSLTEFNSLLSRAERSALESIKGPIPNLVYSKDENRFVYTGADPHYRAVVTNTRLAGFKNVVDLFSDADGQVSPDLRASLAAYGVQFDQNSKPILEVPVPPKTERPQRGDRGPRVQAGQPIQQPVPAAAQPAPAAQLPAPKTQAEYNALPSGTRYIDTDNQVKIKQ